MIDIGGYRSRQTRGGLAALDWQVCEEGEAVHSCSASSARLVKTHVPPHEKCMTPPSVATGMFGLIPTGTEM